MLKALLTIYKELGTDGVLNDIECDFLTENTSRNGREVLWYLDENKSIAIYTDTCEILTEAEIEAELC